ncbi:MAG: hypothetical protein R3F53_14930 [Gammaproteobacteria bacterium]
MVHYAESNYKRIAKGLELLSGLRGEKMAKSERISNYVTQGSKAKKISYRALRRQYSNAGGFADHLFAVDDYCRFITKEIKGREQVSLICSHRVWLVMQNTITAPILNVWLPPKAAVGCGFVVSECPQM